MKNYDELDFTDDFMFGKVMEDKSLCKDVLECILQRHIEKLEDLTPQREFRYTADGKPIKLDIFTGNKHEIFDAEIQKSGKQSTENLNLPRRARFYQSSIDTDLMNKGMRYQDLPDSNIIFICTFDPFKKGKALYEFREICTDEPQIELANGTTKIFCNSCYTGEDIPQGLRDFYNYLKNHIVTNKLTARIESAVKEARLNEKWRSQYMKEKLIFMDYKEEGRAEGFAEGRAEERKNTLKEKKRADAAEARVRELEKMLAKS